MPDEMVNDLTAARFNYRDDGTGARGCIADRRHRCMLDVLQSHERQPHDLKSGKKRKHMTNDQRSNFGVSEV